MRMLAKVSAKVYLLKRFGMLRCEVYPLQGPFCVRKFACTIHCGGITSFALQARYTTAL